MFCPKTDACLRVQASDAMRKVYGGFEAVHVWNSVKRNTPPTSVLSFVDIKMIL